MFLRGGRQHDPEGIVTGDIESRVNGYLHQPEDNLQRQ
jgi:hypothetical protein